MKISLDAPTERPLIRGYTEGSVRIDDSTVRESLILFEERIITDWPPERFEDLTAEHLEQVVALDPELIVLGTGASLRFPRPDVMRPVAQRQIGLEVMDTGAACRTYNVLVAEERRVALAVLMI